MHQFRLLCGIWLSAVVLALAGCGQASDHPQLGTVTGTVTLDGKPRAFVTVAFEPQAGGRMSMGVTDTEGRFELTYNGTEKGAAIGLHNVTITSPSPLDAPSPKGGWKDPIPEQYNTKTTLTADVNPGENSIRFDLLSE